MSFDDLESSGSEASLLLQPSERLHELSMFSKSFSSVDAPHALKLDEMNCIVLWLRVEEFLRQSCAEPVAVSYQSDFSALVSLLQGRRVRQQKRQPCKYLLERCFCRNQHKRMGDPLGCSTHIVSASHCTSSANPSTTFIHDSAWPLPISVWHLVFRPWYPWFAHACCIVKMRKIIFPTQFFSVLLGGGAVWARPSQPQPDQSCARSSWQPWTACG